MGPPGRAVICCTQKHKTANGTTKIHGNMMEGLPFAVGAIVAVDALLMQSALADFTLDRLSSCVWGVPAQGSADCAGFGEAPCWSISSSGGLLYVRYAHAMPYACTQGCWLNTCYWLFLCFVFALYGCMPSLLLHAVEGSSDAALHPAWLLVQAWRLMHGFICCPPQRECGLTYFCFFSSALFVLILRPPDSIVLLLPSFHFSGLHGHQDAATNSWNTPSDTLLTPSSCRHLQFDTLDAVAHVAWATLLLPDSTTVSASVLRPRLTKRPSAASSHIWHKPSCMKQAAANCGACGPS
jgi:hypothetical protein